MDSITNLRSRLCSEDKKSLIRDILSGLNDPDKLLRELENVRGGGLNLYGAKLSSHYKANADFFKNMMTPEEKII